MPQIVHLCALLLFGSMLVLGTAQNAAAQPAADFGVVAREVRSSVARIVVTFESKSEIWNKTVEGTAFFVTAQGHLLTAAHVINGSNEKERPPPSFVPKIMVHLDGARTGYRAELVRYGKRDVALIQMVNSPATRPLPIAPSAALGEGAEVSYAGYPGGRWSFKSGLVTNVSAGGGAWLLELPAGVGASGSPMLDPCGRVVGVLVGTYSEMQKQQSSMLPESEFFELVQNLVRKETGNCGGGGSSCVLSGSQTRDYCALLDTAIAYIGYHNGRFKNNLSGAIAGQYNRDGILFNPYIKPYPKSQLNRTDRAAVADCYLSVLSRAQQKLDSASPSQLQSALAREKPRNCPR